MTDGELKEHLRARAVRLGGDLPEPWRNAAEDSALNRAVLAFRLPQ
jgi:hypothetical protein